jgi:alkanesulfonate monooxygenase SsuD/methylene tetrahydromethanopterin reductase-like flavin-dependent oxidoreductase (luciferase family)
LSLSPTGDSPTLGRPRKPLTQAERHALTERDALIGHPDEIIRRIKRLQDGGVEYIMVIDFAGSLDHLRIFAREVMPAFTP